MNEYERTCMNCGKPILECMGFVMAGDFFLALQALQRGERLPKIRERCGKCVMKISLNEEVEGIDFGGVLYEFFV